MFSKKFLSKSLMTVSVLTLSVTLLNSSFISPSSAMDEKVSIKTKKRKTRAAVATLKESMPSSSQRSRKSNTNNSTAPASAARLQDSPHTETYIREKIHCINPRNGTKSCLKCAVSFYNWMRSQSESPQAVDVRGPKTHNMIPRPENNDYMILKDDRQISLLLKGGIQLNEDPLFKRHSIKHGLYF